MISKFSNRFFKILDLSDNKIINGLKKKKHWRAISKLWQYWNTGCLGTCYNRKM